MADPRDTVEQVFKAGQEAAAKNAEQVLTLTKSQFDKASASVSKNFDEVSSFGKDNVDAMLRATAAWTKGWEDFGREWFGYAQASVEKSVSTAKALLTAKSVREVVDLQSDYARSAFESAVTESTKLSEMTLKVANEALAPLSARMNATVEKLRGSLAA